MTLSDEQITANRENQQASLPSNTLAAQVARTAFCTIKGPTITLTQKGLEQLVEAALELQRLSDETAGRRCSCGRFPFVEGIAYTVDDYCAQDHWFDGTPCECQDPEKRPSEKAGDNHGDL